MALVQRRPAWGVVAGCGEGQMNWRCHRLWYEVAAIIALAVAVWTCIAVAVARGG